jgi:hypothetical protein
MPKDWPGKNLMNIMAEQFISHVIIIVCLSLTIHGCLVFNDGLYWDDWMIDSWQRNKNWKAMKRFFAEVGMPILYYQHRLMSYFPHRILAYKSLAVISTTISAVCVYIISVNFELLTPSNALILSMLYISYTGAHMVVGTVVALQYTFPTSLFYCAILTSMISDVSAGYGHLLLRILGLALFLISFNMNSLLVFYFGYLLLRVILFFSQSAFNATETINFVVSNIDYISLPFVFWFVKEKFTPRHGPYANYNRLSFNPLQTIWLCLSLLRNGFEGSITKPISYLFKERLFWFPIIVLCFIIFVFHVTIPVVEPLTQPIAFVIFGFVLLFLAGLPYILVDQPFALAGWFTKNSALLHLPVALIMLGLIHSTIPSHMIMSFTLLLVVTFGLYLNTRYLYYLAVYVKNRSWLLNLYNHPESHNFCIFQVVDRHLLFDPEHRTAYLHYMFEWLWADQSRLGIPELSPRHASYSSTDIDIAIRHTTLGYDLNTVNIAGAQARIIIEPGINRSPILIGIMYIVYNLFCRNRLPVLLRKVTTIKIDKLCDETKNT